MEPEKSTTVCTCQLQVLKNPAVTESYNVPEAEWNKADQKAKLEILLANMEKMQEKINAQLTGFVSEFTEAKEPVQKKPKLAD